MTEASGSVGILPLHSLTEEQHRQNIMIGVSIATTLVSLGCVGLRVYTRAFIVRNIGPEDWTMMAAAIFTMILMFEILVGAKMFKLSFSGSSMTIVDMQNNIKLTMGIIVVYKLVMTLVKISIVLIYLRFAVSKTFERLCKGTICLLATYQFIVIIVVPAQCRPLHKLWDFTGTVEGYCLNANDFYSVTSAFHIVMDIWILSLPIKMFLSIPRPARERLALCFVFGLGLLTTICSIVRYQYLRLFTISSDPFAATLPINTWSMVEVSVAILCASLPTLRPLFSIAQRKRTEQALQKRPPAIPHVGRVISINFDMKSGRDSTSTIVTGKEVELDTFRVDTPPPVPPKDARLNDSMSIKSTMSQNATLIDNMSMKSARSQALRDLESDRDLEKGNPFADGNARLMETIYLKLGR